MTEEGWSMSAHIFFSRDLPQGVDPKGLTAGRLCEKRYKPEKERYYGTVMGRQIYQAD